MPLSIPAVITIATLVKVFLNVFGGSRATYPLGPGKDMLTSEAIMRLDIFSATRVYKYRWFLKIHVDIIY